jgi:hypothetical protein
MSEREISFEGYGEADHSIENGTPSDADAKSVQEKKKKCSQLELDSNRLSYIFLYVCLCSPVPQMIGNRANWMNGMLRNSLRRSDYNR